MIDKSEDNGIQQLPPDKNSPGIKWTGYFLRFLVASCILFIGFVISAYFWNQKSEPRKKKQEELVKRLMAIPAEPQEITLKISGYGRAQALADIDVSSDVNGKVTYLNPKINVGELVKKGELLCRIDKRDYENALNQSLAEIKKLESTYKVKERIISDVEKELKTIIEIFTIEVTKFKRTKQLFEKKVVSRDTYEKSLQEKATRLKQKIVAESLVAKSKLELETIKSDIAKAKADAKKAQDNLDRCEIKSPFLARVNDVFLDEGEYATVGARILEIANETNLEVPVALDAIKAAKILGLMDPKLSIPNYSHWLSTPGRVPVVIEWTQLPKQCCFRGKLSRIEKFDPDTGTINFVVEPLKNNHSKFPLITGMFCKVTLSGQVLKNAFLIPKVAFQLDGNIYVINKEGRLQAKSVEVDGSNEDKVIITSGLKKGDLVVIQRLPRGMIDGMKVIPISPDIEAPQKQLDLTKPKNETSKN